MTAHEIAGHTRSCPRHGQYIGGGCPVCEGIRKPVRGRGVRVGWEAEVERGLRRRPPSGPAEGDEDQ